MSEQFEADYKLTRNLEFLTDKLQQTYRELESEKQKTDRFVTTLELFISNAAVYNSIAINNSYI